MTATNNWSACHVLFLRCDASYSTPVTAVMLMPLTMHHAQVISPVKDVPLASHVVSLTDCVPRATLLAFT